MCTSVGADGVFGPSSTHVLALSFIAKCLLPANMGKLLALLLPFKQNVVIARVVGVQMT